MRKISLLALVLLAGVPFPSLYAGPAGTSTPGIATDPIAHTFSIVAIDHERGEMGVAVQSHWFSVGPVVPWAQPGIGVIATQSLVNISYGPRGLAMLKEGKAATDVVKELTTPDTGRDYRQLAVIDAHGGVATWTGTLCIPEAGHVTGDNYSVQANMMLKGTVWPAMAKAFEEAEGPLAERMLAALDAAQAEGGDIRGRQSAAMIVVRTVASEEPWNDRLVDLRVDDSEHPLLELRRLLTIHRAYEHMNAGDLAVEKGDVETALIEYSTADSMNSDNPEMPFWHAVSLANVGRVEDSLPIFARVFREGGDHWRELARRLPEVNLLEVSDRDLKKILSIR
ncbi:MAG: DUF1028 domain-containing protein [bacterium]